MDSVQRVLLMIEVDGGDAVLAAARVAVALPDARVWGEVDGVDAALLVIQRELMPAA